MGELFLGLAARTAMVAAERSGDPLLIAASAWRLSCIITGRKHPQEALELAMIAAAALERTARAPSRERPADLNAVEAGWCFTLTPHRTRCSVCRHEMLADAADP